jgi:hypothetical protein
MNQRRDRRLTEMRIGGQTKAALVRRRFASQNVPDYTD